MYGGVLMKIPKLCPETYVKTLIGCLCIMSVLILATLIICMINDLGWMKFALAVCATVVSLVLSYIIGNYIFEKG